MPDHVGGAGFRKRKHKKNDFECGRLNPDIKEHDRESSIVDLTFRRREFCGACADGRRQPEGAGRLKNRRQPGPTRLCTGSRAGTPSPQGRRAFSRSGYLSRQRDLRKKVHRIARNLAKKKTGERETSQKKFAKLVKMLAQTCRALRELRVAT